MKKTSTRAFVLLSLLIAVLIVSGGYSYRSAGELQIRFFTIYTIAFRLRRSAGSVQSASVFALERYGDSFG